MYNRKEEIYNHVSLITWRKTYMNLHILPRGLFTINHAISFFIHEVVEQVNDIFAYKTKLSITPLNFRYISQNLCEHSSKHAWFHVN